MEGEQETDKIMQNIYTTCDVHGNDLVLVSSLIDYIRPFMQANLSELMVLRAALDPEGNNPQISSNQFFKVMGKWAQKFNDECSSGFDNESFHTANSESLLNSSLPHCQSTHRASSGNKLLTDCMEEKKLNLSLSLSQSSSDNGQVPTVLDKTFLEEQIKQLTHQNKNYDLELNRVKIQLVSAEESNETLQADLERLKKTMEHEHEVKQCLEVELKDYEEHREAVFDTQRRIEKTEKSLMVSEKQNTALKQQIVTFEEEKQHYEEKISNLHGKLKENQEKIITLQTLSEVKDAELSCLQEVKQELMGEIVDLKKLVHDYKELNEVLQAKYEKLWASLRGKLKDNRKSLPSHPAEIFSKYDIVKDNSTTTDIKFTSVKCDTPFVPAIKTEAFNFYNFDSPYARVKKRLSGSLKSSENSISPLATSDSSLKQSESSENSVSAYTKSNGTHTQIAHTTVSPKGNISAESTGCDTVFETSKGDTYDSPPCMYVIDRSGDGKIDKIDASTASSPPNPAGLVPSDTSSEDEYFLRLSLQNYTSNDTSPHESLQDEISQVLECKDYDANLKHLDNESSQPEVEELIQKLKLSADSIVQLTDENNKLKEKVIVLEETISTQLDNLSVCAEEIKSLDFEVNELQIKNTSYEDQLRKDAGLKNQLEMLKRDLANAHKMLTNNEESIEKHIITNNKLNEELNEQRCVKETLINKQDSLLAKVDVLEKENVQLTDEKNKLYDKIIQIKDVAKNSNMELQSKIDYYLLEKYNMELHYKKYVDEVDAKLEIYQSNLTDLLKQGKISAATIMHLQKNNAELKNDINLIASKRSTLLEKIEADLKHLSDLATSFSEKRGFICTNCKLQPLSDRATPGQEGGTTIQSLSTVKEAVDSTAKLNSSGGGKQPKSGYNRATIKIDRLQAKCDNYEEQVEIERKRSADLDTEKKMLQSNYEMVCNERSDMLDKLRDAESHMSRYNVMALRMHSTCTDLYNNRIKFKRSMRQFMQKWEISLENASGLEDIFDEINKDDQAEVLAESADDPLDKELYLLKSNMKIYIKILEKFTDGILNFSQSRMICPINNSPSQSKHKASKRILKQTMLIARPMSPDSPSLDFEPEKFEAVQKTGVASIVCCSNQSGTDGGAKDISCPFPGACTVHNCPDTSSCSDIAFEDVGTSFADSQDITTSFYEDAEVGIWPVPLTNLEHLLEDAKNKNITEEEMEEKFITFVLEFTVNSSSIKKRMENHFVEINKHKRELSFGVQKLLLLLKNLTGGQSMCQAECLFQSLLRTTYHLSHLAEQLGALSYENRLVLSINTMINYTSNLKRKYDLIIQKSCRSTNLQIRRGTVDSHVPEIMNKCHIQPKSSNRPRIYNLLQWRSFLTAFMVTGTIVCFAYVILQAFGIIELIRYEKGGRPYPWTNWEDVFAPVLRKVYKNGPPPT